MCLIENIFLKIKKSIHTFSIYEKIFLKIDKSHINKIHIKIIKKKTNFMSFSIYLLTTHNYTTITSTGGG